MPRGTFTRNVLSGCLSVILIWLQAGCAPATPEAYVLMTPCSSSNAGIAGNAALNPAVNQIFQYAATPTPDPAIILSPADMLAAQNHRVLYARHAAINLLAYEAERWTKIKEIGFDDSSKVRIAITYLSPELMESVLQNHILAHEPQRVDVWEIIQKEMNQVYERDKLIFLITIIADSQAFSAHRIDLAPREMILRNARDDAVAPMYDDHNLEIPIDLSDGPEFGFLYYPISIMTDRGCEPVLDRETNTKINIETRVIEIDSVSKGPYVWMIHYAPLVETGNLFYVPKYPDGFTTIDTAVFSPLSEPPATDENDVVFWREFGRYIWGQVTLEKP